MVAAVLALAVTAKQAVAAAAEFRLESNVYVFKDRDFPPEDRPAAAAAASEGSRVVLYSPGNLQLGAETLSLDGATFSWSGGRNPPSGITRIQMPEVITGRDQPVELLSAAPVQYLEKQPDGSLKVRDIPSDSAEAPHCRLAFRVEAPEHADGPVQVLCTLSLATVARREKVPGVSLEVGRPVLARFEDRHELSIGVGAWAAMLVRTPNAGPYSLLVLLKVTLATATASGDRLMTAPELAEFFTTYYRHPQPERVSAALASLGPAQLLGRGNWYSQTYRQAEYYCIGFFAALLAEHPERAPEWHRLIEESEASYWLRKVRSMPRQGGRLDAPSSLSWHQEVSLYWGAFSASGNPAYVRILIDRLELVDELNPGRAEAGLHALKMLGAHAPDHPLVRQTLMDARPDANPRTQELIDTVLGQNFEAALQEFGERDPLPPGPHWPQRAPRHYAP